MVEFHHYQHNEISFQVYIICHTLFGQDVRICGNCPELGNWNPQKAYKLKTDSSIYPQWKTDTPIIIRKNSINKIKQSKIEFKVCIVSQNRIKWQINIPNRIVSLQNPCILQLTFDEAKMVVIPKKVTDIDCRGGLFDLIQDMESSQTSSIEFRANYPVQNYFYHPHEEKDVVRRYSGSQLSSNLISQQDLEKDLEFQNARFQIDNDESINSLYAVLKFKTAQMLSFQTQKMLMDHQNRHKKSSKSKSRQRQRSNSNKKKHSNENLQPFLINVPEAKSPTKIQKNLSLYYSESLQKHERNTLKQHQSTEQTIVDIDAQSVSTQRQFGDETQQIYQRDSDVVIEDEKSLLTGL